MSVLLSKIALVFIVNTQPILHFQIVDGYSVDELNVCQAVIAKVAEQEQQLPPDQRIAERLGCVLLSTRYDPDGDREKSPAAPKSNSKPMFKGASPEDVPCKNKEGYACRNTSYKD